MNENVLSTIGNTPIVRLSRIFTDLHFQLYAKLESLNPGGSSKDRPAIEIIKRGLETGLIGPKTVVVESSSGNMGIGLAQACSYYGIRFICVVDPKTTTSNIRLIRAYGAEVNVVTEPDPITGEYLNVRLERVKELVSNLEDSFWPNQYANQLNPTAHHGTMREIVKALDGRVDYLFCATSTCGTLRGVSEYVRSNNLNTKVYAVDAIGSVIFGGPKSKRLIPGHGAAVRPQLFGDDLAHRYIHVSDLDCVVGCRQLALREAIMAGGSSGAVLMALDQVKDEIPRGSNCVLVLPDRGERYLDTVYSDAWVIEHFGHIPNTWQIPMEVESCVMAAY